MIMPPSRTEKYAIWKACERMNITPPEIKNEWESNNIWNQAQLIAWSQIRDVEDAEARTF
jgi:hypothetical protein